MTSILKDKLIIDSSLDKISQARRWAAQHARVTGFNSRDIFAIELAMGEALSNIIRHAYDGEPGHKIHLSLTIDETKLSLTIIDSGRKFDPALHPPPKLDVPKEGGYGIYLIKKVMDEVTYDTSAPKGTQLDLVKYRSGAGRDA